MNHSARGNEGIRQLMGKNIRFVWVKRNKRQMLAISWWNNYGILQGEMVLMTIGNWGNWVDGWCREEPSVTRTYLMWQCLKFQVMNFECYFFFSFSSDKLNQASHSSLSCTLHGQGHSSERILSRHQGHGQNETRGPQRCQTHELKILTLQFSNQLSMTLLNDSWVRVLFVLYF